MNLREWRESKGLTQAQVAEKLDVYPPQVSDWEAGRRRPNLTHAVRILEITKGEVTLQDLARKGPGGR